METSKTNSILIKKTTLDRFENVFLEISDLLWESNRKYIYNCKILNPSDSLPMREGGYIALHSDRILSKKMQMETSIEIVEKSKYKATYSLVKNSNNHLYAATKELSEEDAFVAAEEFRMHESEEEMVAADYGMSVDEYHESLEAEYAEYDDY